MTLSVRCCFFSSTSTKLSSTIDTLTFNGFRNDQYALKTEKKPQTIAKWLQKQYRNYNEFCVFLEVIFIIVGFYKGLWDVTKFFRKMFWLQKVVVER